MSQSTIQTDRLALRPLGEEHRHHFIQLNSHAAVMKYIEGRPLTEQEAVQDHNTRLASAAGAGGLGYWVGYLGAEFIGWWALSPVKTPDGQINRTRAQLGYRLLPKYWRQGFAKEGAKELIRHGFQDLGLREIYAETMAVNAGSRATMAACGLKYVRTFYLEFDDPIPGTEEGEVEYAITREEWEAFPTPRPGP